MAAHEKFLKNFSTNLTPFYIPIMDYPKAYNLSLFMPFRIAKTFTVFAIFLPDLARFGEIGGSYFWKKLEFR